MDGEFIEMAKQKGGNKGLAYQYFVLEAEKPVLKPLPWQKGDGE